MKTGILARAAGLFTLAAGAAFAQQFPFQLLLTSGTSQATLGNNSQVGFNAEIGQAATVHITATYLPSATSNTAIVSQSPQILGAVQFSTLNFPTTKLPLTLQPGGQLSFDVVFKPTSANSATAQLTLPFVENVITNTGPGVEQEALVLVLVGTSPSFILSYVLQSNLNVVQIPSGGAINFTGVPVNTTALANLNITDVGSGLGTIKGITPPAGPAFKLTGTPLLPYSVASGVTLQLQIAYTPTAAATDSDQVVITLSSGAMLTVLLQGNGIASSYAYQIISSTTPAPVTPPGPIALPDTNIGTTSSVTVRVQNIGTATGILNGPSIAGSAFQLTQEPAFPQTLKPNDSFSFTITFAPTQPGAANGTLLVGNDLFTLTGNGLGAKFTYSYASAAGTIALNTGDSVIFSPVQVTQSEKITFTINNAGTQAATISNIGIALANSPFSVSGVAPLPISLSPGASTQFTIGFAPSALSFSQGTLLINSTSIGLSGSGTAPPPLPTYTIQGPSGTIAPQTQPSLSLSLASGYPVALVGTLTLATSGFAVTDPAVQFSTGGRSVQFVIQPNTTSANFASQGSQIFLQAGTVAENITLTPSFQTVAGGIDVTPFPAPTLQLNVATAAPTLLAASVSSVGTNGFTLNVTGFSTTRVVNSMSVQFNPAKGFSIGSAGPVSIDLHQTASVWFQSSASQAFGGQFEISIPFTLTGANLPTGTTLIQALASVSATVTNDIGTSNSVSVGLQ